MDVIRYPREVAKAKNLIERKTPNSSKVSSVVGEILDNVSKNGNPALFNYTKKFDNFNLTKKNLRVSKAEIKNAYKKADKNLIKALKHACKNIKKFHSEQFKKINKKWNVKIDDGIVIGEKISAIDSVGCYIPGGRASYPSTVLMTCVPAKVAGVGRVVIASPPPISDAILVAAEICGVDEIYRVGGAQAIASLAYGTETIKKVSKIIGPGNKYVMAAKNSVYGVVDVDMPAGPSEILIIADESANPKFIRADLLAQAEHDPDARCVLVTNSPKLPKKIKIKNKKNIACVLVKNLNDAVKFANEYAPEHLEILTKNPEKIEGKIKNAGAIFIGSYAPVAAGDYCSGGNHVLPTSGAAKFASQLSVRDFIKSSSVQKIDKKGLEKLRETIEKLADAEGLKEHKKSVSVRFP